MKKVYYWRDSLNDDFGNMNIKVKDIPANYKYYSRNVFYLIAETVLRIIALPIIFVILKVGFLFRLKNRKVISNAKGQSYFLYGNHTNFLVDAYAPYLISFPHKNHVITQPAAASIPGLKTLVKLLGVLPISYTFNGLINLRKAVSYLTSHHRVITIFPEAHIWPYYTDIRPFTKVSFHYPVDTNLPCFAITTVYQKRLLSFIKLPKVVTYVDGPFYPDLSLPKEERIEKLRNDVYNAMKMRVDSNPKYNYCEYIYKEDNNSNSY